MRVLYLDAALTNELGHFANECRFITGALRERGVRTLVFANRGIEPALAQELDAQPLFSFHPNAAPSSDPVCGWLLNYHRIARATAEDLRRIGPVEREDLIFYDCARPAQVLGLIRWAQLNFAADRCPRIHITLGWPPGVVADRTGGGRTGWKQRDPASSLYRFSVVQLAPAWWSRFCFSSPDPTMAEAYGFLLGKPVAGIPNPHRATTSRRSRAGVEAPCVAFLGEQRPNKGYPLVPAIASRLLEGNRPLRLLVQNSWTFMERENAALAALAQRDRRLELRIGTVSAPEWNALLDASDLVVLPYDQVTYSSVTSGIVAEAIANAIPSAVPAGTCMARLLDDYDMPGVVFPRSEPGPVADAVLHALSHLDEIAARARSASDRWHDENSAERLADAILGDGA